MAQVTLPITSRTSSDDNDFADVVGNDQAITTVLNGGVENDNISASAGISYSKLASMSTGAVLLGNAGTPTATTLSGDVTVGATGVTAIGSGVIVNADISASAAIAGSKLADDVVGSYGTILTGGGTYPDETSTSPMFFVGGSFGGVVVAAPTASSNVLLVYLASADYAVSGRTTMLRLRAQQLTNSVGPGTTLTLTLRPVSGISAGALTIGTAVSGSTVAFASTAANTRAQGNSGDFAFPTDGYYVVALSNSGTTAAGSDHSLAFQLQLHHT